MPWVGDLTKCKIYKITSLNNPELVYYGHTCQTLAQRFCSHKAPTNCTTSKLIIEKGDAIILLIEDYPCKSVDIASAREAYYILNNPCVNKQIPGRIVNHELKQERNIKYYENNREKILIQKKQYHDEHKEQRNIYNESHKDEIKEYQKQYNKLHKDKIKEYQKQYRLKKNHIN